VHQGDLLAEIDPRPFQVQLAQAAGQMAKDGAQLTNAKGDLERYKALGRALTEAAQADYDATVAAYRQTVLTAFQSVEDNLAALRILQEEAQQQEHVVQTAEKALLLAINSV
jgi:multidrug resistance efflux pump